MRTLPFVLWCIAPDRGRPMKRQKAMKGLLEVLPHAATTRELGAARRKKC